MNKHALRLLWATPALTLLLPPAVLLIYWYSFEVVESPTSRALMNASSVAFLCAPVVGLLTLMVSGWLWFKQDRESWLSGLRRAFWLAVFAVLSPLAFLAMQIVILVLSGHC